MAEDIADMLGVFDSGVGGLTVVRELIRRHPSTSFVYLGDTARTPYGNKSPEIIRAYAIQDAQFLVDQGATTIVVACNTVSAIAMDALNAAFPKVTFVEVITPAVEAALAVTRGGKAIKRIGVIGTRTTVGSGIYERLLKEGAAAQGRSLDVISTACPLFVPLAEEGWTHAPETKRIVRTYLQPIRQKQVDALILGCTHYPMLAAAIRASIQRRVTLVDSASSVVDRLMQVAPQELATSAAGTQRYCFTDASTRTAEVVREWVKRPATIEQVALS